MLGRRSGLSRWGLGRHRQRLKPAVSLILAGLKARPDTNLFKLHTTGTFKKQSVCREKQESDAKRETTLRLTKKGGWLCGPSAFGETGKTIELD